MYSEDMENVGFPYGDLSLFNGDLLLEDVTEHLPVVAQAQGLKDGPSIHEAVPAAPTLKASVHVALAHPQNGSQELGLQDLLAVSPTQDLPDPFTANSAWFDTKTDLVDLLTGVEPAPVQQQQQSQQQQVLDFLTGNPLTQVVTSVQQQQDGSIESLEAIQSMLLADLPMDVTITPVKAEAEWSSHPSLVYTPESPQPSNADIDILEELNQAGLDQLLASAPDPNTASLLDVPAFSPVSADDVESLLSASPPPSPSEEATLSSLFSSFTNNTSSSGTLDQHDVEEVLHVVGPTQRPVREKVARASPYTVSSPSTSSASPRKGKAVDRRERKKLQNRTAALRYREKKRSEQDVLQDECNELEEKNAVLRDKVDSIEREMKYLKDLMAEVARERSKVKKKGGAS